MRPRSLLRALAAGLVIATVALGGCDSSGTPKPSASGTGQPRPFTIMSLDPIRVADPAAITDAASAVLSLNVFQRLMTAQPGESLLRPDAARDCLFTAATVYTCTLNKDLRFHNGHQLTSSDVKFSIQRATRLAVPQSSASLLSSLRRIETPDPLTVRFVLSGPDTQFGWALASPAASIVDEETYTADDVQPLNAPIIGSGPFSVTSFGDGELSLARFPTYIGHNPARMASLVYKTAPDSATVEDAMHRGLVDVVWRGVNSAAVTRYTSQISQSANHLTADGFSMRVYNGLRVRELAWSPTSRWRAVKGLRQAIAVALQGDRTLDSILPGGVPGHIPSFPLGGKATPKVTWKNRIRLTLGYDSTAPDARDVATQIRTRLEDTGGLSVLLRPDLPSDLNLLDRKAWTATALAWLQPYLDAPLPSVRSTVTAEATQYRGTTDPKTADSLLAQLQHQSVDDATVLPLTQGDEQLFARRGVDVDPASFGPGWQLGLFGIFGG